MAHKSSVELPTRGVFSDILFNPIVDSDFHHGFFTCFNINMWERAPSTGWPDSQTPTLTPPRCWHKDALSTSAQGTDCCRWGKPPWRSIGKIKSSCALVASIVQSSNHPWMVTNPYCGFKHRFGMFFSGHKLLLVEDLCLKMFSWKCMRISLFHRCGCHWWWVAGNAVSVEGGPAKNMVNLM